MTENLISVKEFAEANGLLRQTVFKVLKRLGIEPSKSRGGSQNRRQTISYITEHDARSVLEALASNRNFQNEQDGEETKVPDAAIYDIGVKHNVENWECEQVFLNRPLLVLDDPKHSVSEERWAAFGKTDGDRFLVVIFTKRNHLIRIISARDMNRRERKFYPEKG